MHPSKKVLAYAHKYQGDWSLIAQAIKNDEEIEPIFTGENYLTIFDENYPEKLRKLRYPPWIIFYEGDVNLLYQKAVSIIGSREVSSYGEKVTAQLATKLAKEYVIVSGMAKGVDAIAHRNALKVGHSIGIIGSGLDTHYPHSNEDLYEMMETSQLLISEYPMGTPIKKRHFPWRNRIIAALSEKVYVTQARCQSGTMLTVNEANILSKEVWCIPYPIDDINGEGCNLLISQGAQILINDDHLY